MKMTEKKEWLNDLRVRVQGADHVKAPEGLLDDLGVPDAHRD